MFKPEVEDVGINIGFGQPHAQHPPPTHNKTPAGSAPMTLTQPLAFQSCCPGQPRGSVVHAVHTHRCAACHGQNHSRRYRQWAGHRAHALIGINLFQKPLPRVQVCFRGRQGFFICHARFVYMSRPVCQAPAIWPSVSHQTAQRDRIGRRRDGLSPPAQASPGRSFGPSDACGAWEQSAGPNA